MLRGDGDLAAHTSASGSGDLSVPSQQIASLDNDSRTQDSLPAQMLMPADGNFLPPLYCAARGSGHVQPPHGDALPVAPMGSVHLKLATWNARALFTTHHNTKFKATQDHTIQTVLHHTSHHHITRNAWELP